MAKDIPGPWVRRPIAIVGLIIITFLIPVVSPVALLVSFIADLANGRPEYRRTRMVALITGLLLIDFAGMVVTAIVWLASPFGYGVDRAHIQARYRRIMTWWTTLQLKTFTKTIPLPVDRSQLDESLLGGNAIVIGRHRSLLDAIVPAVIFGNLGIHVLYVLKADLQWDINIDLVGHRMGHVFVNRSPKDLDKELEPIRELAAGMDDNAVSIIFPEGTFFNERRKARAVKSLERRNPAHAEIAQQLNYLLPPRPAGTLALLEAAPDADVVFLGHVGFERFGTIKQILANLGGDHGIVLRAWRFARDEVPTAPSEQIDWLFDRWLELDEWIGAEHGQSGAPSSSRAIGH